MKSEHEALEEVERLKEKLRSRHLHHQQESVKAREARQQLEADIEATKTQLHAEKENATVLAGVVDRLKKKGAVVLGHLESRGYDGIIGRDLQTVELASETADLLDTVERQLLEAKEAVATTAEMIKEEEKDSEWSFAAILQDLEEMAATTAAIA